MISLSLLCLCVKSLHPRAEKLTGQINHFQLSKHRIKIITTDTRLQVAVGGAIFFICEMCVVYIHRKANEYFFCEKLFTFLVRVWPEGPYMEKSGNMVYFVYDTCSLARLLCVCSLEFP